MLHLIKYSSMITMMVSCFLLTFNDDGKLCILAVVNMVIMIISDCMIAFETREKDITI